MKIQVAEMTRLEKTLYEILAKATGHALDRIEKDCDRDNFMSALEAKQYGLIDDVFVRKPASLDKK
jgi:ATP-dependent Clp protease protease subunit